MPPKRKFAAADSAASRFTAKRKARRTLRRPSPSSTAVVHVGRGPVAPKTIVKLRYADSWSHGGATMDYQYRMNSIFDPDLLGVGHQPLGRDQYATFYNRYRVTALTMVLYVTPLAQCVTGYKILILGDNSVAVPGSPFPAIEQRGTSIHMPLGGPNFSASLLIKRSWTLRNITGVTEQEYQDDRFQSLMSTNPAENIVLHIMASMPGGGYLQGGDLVYNLRLDYTVEMFDPLELASS